MRLCWNDWFGGPLRNLNPEDAKIVRDIGFRVVGINSGDIDATDADIDRVKKIFDDNGLVPGPYGAGRAAFNSDAAMCKEYKSQIAKALKVAGKLGCTGLRFSVGSMHPTDVWRHHPENHTQKALDMLVESTRELVPVAEDTGCMLCPETNAWTIVNSIERMKEYVERLDSPYAKVIFDPVNHMNPQRVFESAEWMSCAIAYLGDCIGELHVKDVQVMDNYMIHIEEAQMGTGLLDHASLIKASNQLEPWKTYSLEHIRDRNLLKPAYDYIQGISNKIGHKWTDPKLTHDRWNKMQGN
ncbi:sugar phosphate isomerase/epimerase family protein [Candidatus Latescibacterota bacterium]